MSKIIAIVLLLCLGINSKAQDFTYFNKTYGGNDTINILAQAVQPIEDGYLVFGGYSDINNDHALYVRKIDNLGETVWLKSIEAGTFSTLGGIWTGLQVLKDNNFLLVTYSKYTDISLTKLNFEGDTLMQKIYPRIGNQYAMHIIKSLEGGYLIGGMESNSTLDTVSAYILKIDSLGNKEWDKSYTYGNDTRFFNAQQYYDSTYIFGAMTYTTATKYDMFVVKTQANGDTIWTKRFGSVRNDCGCIVQQKTTYEQYLSGSSPVYLVAGCYASNNTDSYMYILELNELGNVNWQKKYFAYSDQRLIQGLPIIKPDGGFIAKGYFRNEGFPAVLVMDFDSIGIINWEQHYSFNPLGSIYAQDFQPIPGGYVLAGYQYNIPQTAWVFTIDSLGNTCGSPPCVETVVGLPEIVGNEQAAATFSLAPNPTQGSLVLTWLDPTAALGSKAVILDITSKQVHTFGVSSPNTFVDVSHLQTGIYFVQVANGQEVQKLVVIK